MRRLIAKGGAVPAVKISAVLASPKASAQTQLAEIRTMKVRAAWVAP
jgi:hypothetical protein